MWMYISVGKIKEEAERSRESQRTFFDLLQGLEERLLVVFLEVLQGKRVEDHVSMTYYNDGKVIKCRERERERVCDMPCQYSE